MRHGFTGAARAAVAIVLFTSTMAAGRIARADDKADALLRQVDAATQSARTLTGDLAMDMSAGGRNINLQGKVALKKPNLALITMGKPIDQTIASDGKSLFTVPGSGGQFTKAVADPAGKNIEALWAIPVAMFFDPQNISFAKRSGATAAMLPPQTVDGQQFQIVQLTGTAPFAYTLKLFVRPDNIVSRMALEIKQQGLSAHYGAALSNLKLGEELADAKFAYTPPAGAKAAEAPDEEGKLVAVGKGAPPFSIPTPLGGSVTLSKALSRNKAVVVNFWFYG